MARHPAVEEPGDAEWQRRNALLDALMAPSRRARRVPRLWLRNGSVARAWMRPPTILPVGPDDLSPHSRARGRSRVPRPPPSAPSHAKGGRARMPALAGILSALRTEAPPPRLSSCMVLSVPHGTVGEQAATRSGGPGVGRDKRVAGSDRERAASDRTAARPHPSRRARIPPAPAHSRSPGASRARRSA